MKFIISALLFGLTVIAPTGLMAKDVALVIANVNGSKINNTRTTASELGALVRAYEADGYDVVFEREANSQRMLDAIRRFNSESRNADRLVVHLIGDVVPTRQNLFLRPTDVSSSSLVELYRSGLGSEMVYDMLAHRPGRSAFVLATSDTRIVNRLRTRGHIPQGVLVLTGEALSVNRAIRDGFLQGETALDVGKRTGIAALGFVSDIPMTQRGASGLGQPTVADAALIEMQVWRDAAQNGSQQALQNYINRYPNGLFRGEAQARLNALVPPKSVEETVEENLRLSRADRRKIQENLTSLGFNTRGVDGLFGPGTRAAIERWQRTEGFQSSGYLDRAQIRVLNVSAEAKAQADRATRERDDLAYWQQTGSGTNERGLRDYLAKYPSGLFAPQAKQALDGLQQNNQSKQNQAAIQRENALQMTPKTRALVEQRLVGLGYKTGPVDGNFTRETRAAIRAFQQKAGLNATGYMDNQTVTRLVASIFR